MTKKPTGAYTRKPTAEEIETAHRLAAVAASVDPEVVADATGDPDTTPPSGAEHRQDVGVEDAHQVQYTLDPQMVQQAMQNRNARLIAMMVNENAMMEVALEQERAANNELRAKMRAMKEAFGVSTGTD